MKVKGKVPIAVDRLKNALIWAWFDVNQYKELFLSGTGRTKLLVETAGHFFNRLSKFYWDRFTLAISRLTDPATQGRSRNLSIHLLEDYVSLLPSRRQGKVLKVLESIDEKAGKYRTHRSKHIAHDDYRHAISKKPGLVKLSLDEIESILSDIGRCLNEFYLTIEDSTWSWEMGGIYDAGSLAYFLKEGAIYNELKQRRRDWKLDAIEEQQSSFSNA
jgi:hypothetical protein